MLQRFLAWLRPATTQAPPIPRLPDGETRLVPFSETNEHPGYEPLCDGWLLYGIRSFEQLVDRLRKLQAEHADIRILSSLDNRYQADYTSGHATDTHELDFVLRKDAPDAPEEWFDGEEVGYLEGRAGFPYRLANLRAKAVGVELAQLSGLLPWIDEHVPGNDPVAINRQPDAFLMLDREREVEVQRVPVAHGHDALAAFPNGYFTSDLDPMQNHTFAKVLEERHGLGLFGVGASTLGFWREAPLTASEAQDVAAVLVPIYSDAPSDAAEQLAQAITGKREVLYRYTES